jgi:hypothetical protein
MGRPVDPCPEGNEAWRVFVRLRHRPETFERLVRACSSGCAEDQVAVADREVLLVLGSQRVKHGFIAGSSESEYRILEPAYRVLAEIHRDSPSGGNAFTSAPVVEVVRPKTDD